MALQNRLASARRHDLPRHRLHPARPRHRRTRQRHRHPTRTNSTPLARQRVHPNRPQNLHRHTRHRLSLVTRPLTPPISLRSIRLRACAISPLGLNTRPGAPYRQSRYGLLVALSAKPIRALGRPVGKADTGSGLRLFRCAQYGSAHALFRHWGSIRARNCPETRTRTIIFEKKPSHFFFDDIIPMQGQRSTADSVVARDRVPHSGEVV